MLSESVNSIVTDETLKNDRYGPQKLMTKSHGQYILVCIVHAKSRAEF